MPTNSAESLVPVSILQRQAGSLCLAIVQDCFYSPADDVPVLSPVEYEHEKKSFSIKQRWVLSIKEVSQMMVLTQLSTFTNPGKTADKVGSTAGIHMQIRRG